MKKELWNEGWKFWKDRNAFELLTVVPKDALTVELPYDALIREEQKEDLSLIHILRYSRNPSNIRNPLIYCVNRFFLIFDVSQVQKPYRASTNGFLTF